MFHFFFVLVTFFFFFFFGDEKNRENNSKKKSLDTVKRPKTFSTLDPCHPTPPHIRQPRQDAGQARKRACCVVGAPQLSDSANKLIRCWHRGVVVRGDCCVFRPQSSAAASSSPQHCSSTMGSHGSPLRSHSRLASIAKSLTRLFTQLWVNG